jgi:hypothetical protein
MASHWGNRQFWADATWRAFRTWAQTMAATLSGYAVFLGVQLAKALKDPGADVDLGAIIGGWELWLLFFFVAGVAAAISLFQSIDRERAVSAALPSIAPAQPSAPPPVVLSVPLATDPAPPTTSVLPLTDSAKPITVACGDAVQ